MAARTKAKSAGKGTAALAGGGKSARAVSTPRVALTRSPHSTILVTGGTGFLGQHLIRQLLDSGTVGIRVLASRVPQWMQAAGIDAVEGSITNAEDVARAVAGITDIYHLAGRVSRVEHEARQMYAIHVDGTRLLCDAASAAGVATIVVSSSSGTLAVARDNDERIDEDSTAPLDIITRWPYYASKYYQERAALSGFSGKQRRLVILNPSLLLGPGDDRLSSTKVVLDFLARKISATPNGGLNFVDVRDVAAAFRVAMVRGRHGEKYLLGGANMSFQKFFGKMERLSKVNAPRISLPSKFAVAGAHLVNSFYSEQKRPAPVQAAAVEMAEYFWYFESDKAARELGFIARDGQITLDDTIRYLRANMFGNNGAL